MSAEKARKSDKRRKAEEPTVEPTAAETSDSFGTWLRRQREGRQIALREIADSSKISLRYLQALESDRFDVLPAAVFAKGFLRQYARYVGLDPEDVINFYLSARQAQDLESDAPEETSSRASGDSWLGGWKLVLLVLVLLGLVALLFRLNEWRRSNVAGATSPSAATTPAPTPTSPAAPPAVASPETTGATGAVANGPAGGSSSEVPTETSSLAGADDELAEPAEGAAEPTSSTAPIRVKLDFRSECWVQVRTDGRRALSETKVQGESIDFDAEELVDLTFGDGGAVAVEVNGFPFAFEATPGQVVRLTIDEDTVRALASGSEP